MMDAALNPAPGQPSPPLALWVEPSRPEDRRGITDLILASGIFGRGDADCVDGMFADAMNRPSEDGYRFVSCWEGGAGAPARLIGFACTGREALTRGTWDLFWVCVEPASRGKGAGRALLAEVQRLAAADRARLMVIYTSSTGPYAPARRLYESQGFARAAVIPEYYAAGDDLFIYTKRL